MDLVPAYLLLGVDSAIRCVDYARRGSKVLMVGGSCDGDLGVWGVEVMRLQTRKRNAHAGVVLSVCVVVEAGGGGEDDDSDDDEEDNDGDVEIGGGEDNVNNDDKNNAEGINNEREFGDNKDKGNKKNTRTKSKHLLSVISHGRDGRIVCWDVSVNGIWTQQSVVSCLEMNFCRGSFCKLTPLSNPHPSFHPPSTLTQPSLKQPPTHISPSTHQSTPTHLAISPNYIDQTPCIDFFLIEKDTIIRLKRLQIGEMGGVEESGERNAKSERNCKNCETNVRSEKSVGGEKKCDDWKNSETSGCHGEIYSDGYKNVDAKNGGKNDLRNGDGEINRGDFGGGINVGERKGGLILDTHLHYSQHYGVVVVTGHDGGGVGVQVMVVEGGVEGGTDNNNNRLSLIRSLWSSNMHDSQAVMAVSYGVVGGSVAGSVVGGVGGGVGGGVDCGFSACSNGRLVRWMVCGGDEGVGRSEKADVIGGVEGGCGGDGGRDAKKGDIKNDVDKDYDDDKVGDSEFKGKTDKLRIKQLKRRELEVGISCMALRGDGRVVALGDFEGRVHLLTGATLKYLALIPYHTESLLHLSFNPHNNHLAVGCNDRSISFWTLYT